MFNKNFFPTPSYVISSMLEGIDHITSKMILEPSCGKCDILDYIVENKARYSNKEDVKSRMYCIEIEPELQSIIKDKGYRLVASDFLDYNSDYIFDLIIMNPPFDDGATHLLKAWEISKGAEIRCLLNAETINNSHTAERSLLKSIIERHGEVINLGQCFKNAERKSNVEVVLVKLKDKAYKSNFKFTAGNSKEEQYSFDDIEHKQVATKDVFQSMESRYNKVKDLMVELLKVQSEIDFYAEGLVDTSCTEKSISELIKETHSRNIEVHFNNFIELFRKKCWNTILKKTNIDKLTTKAVRQDFFKYQEEQGYMAFTKDNMIKLFDELFHSQGEIMQKCVEEAFDTMTKYYKENRCHIEGWKTNDRWQVTKKVILPCMRDVWCDKYPKLNYTAKDILQDIEKALCFITKKSYDKIKSVTDVFDSEITIVNGTKHTICKSFGEWYDSEFFKIKMFKKGTIHIEFNDEWLYQQFNLTACNYKNWLIHKEDK